MLKKENNLASPNAKNNSELGHALKAMSPRIRVRSDSIQMSKLYRLRDKKLVIVEPGDMYPDFHRVYNMPVTSNFGQKLRRARRSIADVVDSNLNLI